MAYADDGAGAGLGEDEGGYVLSLRNLSGGVEKAIIGAAAGTNEVWAKTSEGVVVRVRDSLLAVCRESQRTVEDTRVFPVEAAAVTSITVDEGFPAYVLSRKTPTDPWRLASPVDAPADADHAEKLLSGLLALRGIDIMLSATNTVKVSVSTEATNFPPCAVLEKSLIGDEKERAEHLMLVDLGRNDIGRTAKPGSVLVADFMHVERYSHVMHLVSSVEGQIRDDRDAFDLVSTAFPAGTLSGAPKIRAMEIIHELEPGPRGFYGGAVGYFSCDGNMDLAITIRTIEVSGSRLKVQAGCGIVADSVPEMEYQETLNKARALFKAVEFAQKGFK